MPRSFFGVVPQAPPRRRRLHADGLGRTSACCGSAALGGDRSRAGAAATRTGRRSTRSSAGGAREGVAHAAVRLRHAELGARARRSAVTHGRACPTRRRASGRSRRGGGSSPPRSAATGPTGSFWSRHPSSRAPDPRLADLERAELADVLRREPSVRSYARLLSAAHEAIAARDPGAKVILGGMFGKPLGGRKPVIAASDYLAEALPPPRPRRRLRRRRAAPVRRRARRGAWRRSTRCASGSGAPATTPGLWITEVGWASGGPPQPAQPRSAGPGRAALEGASRYLLANAPAATDRDRGLVLVARQRRPAMPGLCDWCPQSGLLPRRRYGKAVLRRVPGWPAGRRRR